MRQRTSSSRRPRGWPSAGQIGLAVIAGLVIATFAGVLSRGRDGSKAAAPSTTRLTSEPTTVARSRPSTTSVARSSVPTTPVTRSRPPTTVVTPRATRLTPLTIAPATHADAYSRAIDFGGWSDVHGCQDTRATLLINTSRAPVTFTTASECTVKTGKWIDPWSGTVSTVAHALQIDHTVPLANAWRSGAWSWTHDQRVAYANDLADGDHLLPILVAENEAKGDSGPDEWKPPAPSSWCRYALDWDRIKAKWHLTATTSEWTALREMIATC